MGTSRREAIAQAALQLFNTRGLEATSIQDICAASGASVGSVYHWFGNKNGIASALLVDALQSNLDAIEKNVQAAKTARQLIAAVISGVLTWASANPERATFVYTVTIGPASDGNRDALAEVSAGWGRLWERQVERHWQSGALRRLPRDAFVSILLGPTHDYLRRWLSGQVTRPPEELADVLADAAWRALKGER